MGTEVLYPQDVLGIRLMGPVPTTTATAVVAAAFLPRRKLHGSNPNPSPNPRPHRRMEPKKRKEGSPKEGSSNLVMGQVTILRRGQSLDSSTKGKERDGQQQQQQRKKKQERDAAAVLSSVGGGDLIVFGTGRLGPDPAAVPKKIRLGEGRRGAGAVPADVYAGSAFSNSPSPRALPLPNFSRRREGGGCGGAVVDPHSATKDLRRLLRLD